MAGPVEEAPAAASPRDGVTEEAASPAAAARSRGFWLLGEDKSVHKALGGGKTADVLLWKDKKTSSAVVGGATILWLLFEVVEYHLLTLVSHLLIAALTILFLWSNATVFINKSPDVPEVQISEELAVNIALALRADINKVLVLLREIALGHNLKKFLGVIVALWIISEIGELCDLLRLMYIVVLILHTVPILYHKYQDKVDDFAAKAHAELCKQYKVLDAKVLSKIPRAPPKDKKEN
ncbi:unnamed protein product [Urochloa decumbens]|uniref:Reticulon-like protein n=1 Tax=Urochloa decumbens TaxID=240449 RepID=A0ABC9CMD0_9POAL